MGQRKEDEILSSFESICKQENACGAVIPGPRVTHFLVPTKTVFCLKP